MVETENEVMTRIRSLVVKSFQSEADAFRDTISKAPRLMEAIKKTGVDYKMAATINDDGVIIVTQNVSAIILTELAKLVIKRSLMSDGWVKDGGAWHTTCWTTSSSGRLPILRVTLRSVDDYTVIILVEPVNTIVIKRWGAMMEEYDYLYVPDDEPYCEDCIYFDSCREEHDAKPGDDACSTFTERKKDDPLKVNLLEASTFKV